MLRFASLLSMLTALTQVAVAQSSYPMLMSLEPVAASIGQSSEHTLESRYSMFGFDRVIVTGEGVTGEILTPMELDKDSKEPSLTKIQLRFTIAADAAEGVRDFRIVGPTGASTLGQLVVSRHPVLSESANNDTRDTAMEVVVPATLCGAIEKGEDVDVYRFHLDHPQTLIFQMFSMRLQDKIHDLQTHADPIVTIRNASGSTVATADNVYAADPFLAHTFSEAGDYFIEVRDVRYQGNRYWQYAIEVGERPYVRTVHPLAVQLNQSSQLKLIGENLGDDQIVEWTPGATHATGAHEVQLPFREGRLNPVQLYVSEEPVVIERAQVSDDAEVQSIELPGVIAGQIEKPSDIDQFQFSAKKGDRLTFEVVARRLNSSMDPILWITNAEGRSLIENDDLSLWGKRTYQDSKIENWAVPADGEYFVNIRDVHLRGGETFTYVLKTGLATPDFELVLDSDKTNLAPGTAGAIFARVIRKNGFSGEVALSVDHLPEGVTAHNGRILASGTDGCIVLEAAADSEPGVSNIVVRGKAIVEEGGTEREISVIAQSMQETYMPGGGRNHWPVELHTVAVGAPTNLLGVQIDQTEVSLKPGESVKIGVSITRAPEFDKNVTLDMLFQHLSSKFADTLPKGVTIDGKESKTLLTGKETTGHIVLVASEDAVAVEKQQCCVMANVSLNFVMKATYSSSPLFVTVTDGK